MTRYHSLPAVLVASLVVGSGLARAETPIALAYNFNGMVHAGEAGAPDAPDGFRSISDRAMDLAGGANPFGDGVSPNSGLTYDINNAAGALDVVHIGNRNTVDGGNKAFDPFPDGDFIGIQPTWLPNPDQTSVSMPVSPAIPLDAASRIGFLYNVSNGGGSFNITLQFTDLTSVTVTVNAPDWFGPFAGIPGPPGPGVELQQNRGTFDGTQDIDQANPGATLIVTEAVISAVRLLADLGFNVNGKQLSGLGFGNRSNVLAGYEVFAATAIETVPVELQGFTVE